MTSIVTRLPFADPARFMEVKTLKPKSPSRLEAAMPTDWCGETLKPKPPFEAVVPANWHAVQLHAVHVRPGKCLRPPLSPEVLRTKAE
jgi:hypothetical protein